MSQQKVEQKKELKKNRKEIVKKNHAKSLIRNCIGIVVGLLVVAYLAFSGVQQYNKYKEANPSSLLIDNSALTDYEDSLSPKDAE